MAIPLRARERFGFRLRELEPEVVEGGDVVLRRRRALVRLGRRAASAGDGKEAEEGEEDGQGKRAAAQMTSAAWVGVSWSVEMVRSYVHGFSHPVL